MRRDIIVSASFPAARLRIGDVLAFGERTFQTLAQYHQEQYLSVCSCSYDAARRITTNGHLNLVRTLFRRPLLQTCYGDSPLSFGANTNHFVDVCTILLAQRIEGSLLGTPTACQTHLDCPYKLSLDPRHPHPRVGLKAQEDATSRPACTLQIQTNQMMKEDLHHLLTTIRHHPRTRKVRTLRDRQ